MIREMNVGQDCDFSEELFLKRYNSDLANDLGNLAQRSLSLIAKNLGAVLPRPGAFSDEDTALLTQTDALLEKCRAVMDRQEIHLALGDIWQVVAEANRYFAAQEPWALKKTDPERMGTVLYVTAEVIRQVAILCQPVLPTSSARLLDILAVAEDARDFAGLGAAGRLAPGAQLPKPEPVFPRYVEEKADEGAA